MPINTNANFEELSAWLNQNLLSPNSFVPHIDKIPNVNSKGIYFWFIHPDGYKALSNHVRIEPVEPKYTRNIDGVKYDLVYVGTAGTGKKGDSNLCERFEWHIIKPHHTDSNICHGTLSTLRAGLGALLSNDLILLNTEIDVNDFMKYYMKVFWIEYPNDINLIDDDEIHLIKTVKPLFNLDYNSNSYKTSKGNPTKLYKNKRDEVYKRTKERIGCNNGKTSRKAKLNIPYQSKDICSELISERGCIEFLVKQNQSAHERIQNFDFLKNTKYSIVIFETLNPANFICTNYNFTKTPTKYFGRNDTNPDRQIDNREPARWKVIQKVMIENKIEEVIIRLCPVENILSDNNKANSKSINDIKKLSANEKIDDLLKSLEWEKLKDKKTPKLLIIGCSDSKTPGGNNQIRNYFNDVNLLKDRTTNLNNYNQLLQEDPNYFIYKENKPNKPIKRNGNRVTDDYFSNCINENLLKPAINRYAGGKFYTDDHLQLYIEKNISSNLHILIISALYGVIEFRDSIIDYHLEVKKTPFWTLSNNFSINNSVKKYIEENNIDNEMVFYSLSSSGKHSYTNALKPMKPWKNIWISIAGQRNKNLGDSAKCASRFLNQLP